MCKCDDFIRDKDIEWVDNLNTPCDVCVYKDNALGCKIDTSDNRTSIIHGYHSGGNGSRVRGVLR